MLWLLASAEASKVPWYVAGGVLAVWAVVVSAIGLSRPGFPGSKAGRQLVIAVSFVLMVAAMTAAVVTG